MVKKKKRFKSANVEPYVGYLQCIVETLKGQGENPGSLYSIRRAIVLAGLQQVADDRGEIAQVAAKQGLWAALVLWLPGGSGCSGILRLDELVVLH